jgi:hypothetical protein
MAIEVFNRFEKFLPDEYTFQRFYNRLLARMVLNDYNRQHGYYSIRNLYFDTKHGMLIRKSSARPNYKEKLRLRSYGVPKKAGCESVPGIEEKGVRSRLQAAHDFAAD